MLAIPGLTIHRNRCVRRIHVRWWEGDTELGSNPPHSPWITRDEHRWIWFFCSEVKQATIYPYSLNRQVNVTDTIKGIRNGGLLFKPNQDRHRQKIRRFHGLPRGESLRAHV